MKQLFIFVRLDIVRILILGLLIAAGLTPDTAAADMTKLRFAATLIVAGVTACGAINSEASGLRFCPSNAEAEAREGLGIGSSASINIDELLGQLRARGVSYEVAKIDNQIVKCENVEAIPSARSYKVYTGFDESKTFVRGYLVVADASGSVRYIEARHQYPAPKIGTWSD